MPLFPSGAMTLVRRLAQSHILSGVTRSLTGGEIIGALQRSDLWYKSTDYGSDFAYWKEGVRLSSKLKHTWRNEVLNPDLYLKTGYEMKARYETLIKVRWKHRLTGEIHENIYTVPHEHLEAGVNTPDLSQTLTRIDLEEAAKKMSAGGDIEKYGDVISVVPIMGFYNPAIR